MKFTVVMSPVADHQLAEIWMNATDRASVSQAFDRIEVLLKREAHVLGRLHPSGWRVVTMSPLAVTFRVSMDDRLVKVMSVFYRPKPTS
jgi:hypothetical protein